MKNNSHKKLRNELIHSFFIEAPHPMAITRADDGTYLEVNEAAARYMKFSREELIGRRLTDLGHMPKATRQRILEEIKATGCAGNIELESSIKKKETLYLLFNIFAFNRGSGSFFLSVVTDISRSKHKNDVLFRLRMPDDERVKNN